MEIKIRFSKKFHKNRKKLKNSCYGIFWIYENKSRCFIELCTKQYRSTIKTLIHEIHHQVLYELEDEIICLDYDNISKKLEKYIFN